MDMMDVGAKVEDEVVYPSEGSDSVKYKGVRKRKWGKWVSEIRVPHSRDRIWLGSYDTAEKAARAFDAALYCLRGSHANFNFPSTPSEIDVPTHQSFTPEEIQEIAAAFANGHQTSQQGTENLESSRAMHEENIDSTSNMVSEENHIQPLSLGCEIMPEFDHNEFSNPLHLNEDGSSHQSFYLGLEKMHSDDLLLYPPLLIPGEDNVDDIHGGDHEAFSTPSFLWNF